MTAGFKLWRRTALQDIGLANIRSNGYSFQVEMAYLSEHLGFRIIEIPDPLRGPAHRPQQAGRAGEARVGLAHLADSLALSAPGAPVTRRRSCWAQPQMDRP